jgi:hypothetical protein
MRQSDSPRRAGARALVLSLTLALLSACGDSDSGTSAALQASTATQSISKPAAAQSPSAAKPWVAKPAFHLAPIILKSRAPWKRALSQWEIAPPGNCLSSR